MSTPSQLSLAGRLIICRVCGAEAVVSHPGYRVCKRTCQACRKIGAAARRKATPRSDKDRERERAAYAKRFAAGQSDPELMQKLRTRALTKHAIRDGRLFRQPCAVCGELKVDAHHEDYSKPLDVIWLCRPHHGDVHTKVPSHSGLSRVSA